MIGFPYFKSKSVTDIEGLDKTDGNMIVADGSGWVAESGETVRATLGVTIGDDIQAHSSQLDDIASAEPFNKDGETLTLQNIDAMDETSIATVLSNITQETQHHIGCLIVSDMSYAKTLYLPADATDSAAKSMFDVSTGEVYVVPTGKVFLAGLVSCYLDHGYGRGRIDEGTALDGQITHDQMCFGSGATSPDASTPAFGGTYNCPGVFTAGKYVNAESTGSYSLRTPTFVYGVEVSIVPEITIQFNIGGYICEDYNELKLLICFGQPTNNTKVTFHEWNGSSWVNYDVPENKVYIAGKVSYWIDYATNRGIVGESNAEDATLTKNVLCFGKGSINGQMEDVYGRFTATKWVNIVATTGFAIRTPTYMYGVEIDA